MNLIIHHGTHNIGGSCVEIQSQDTRIILDIGIPLEEKGKKFDFKKYKGLPGPRLVIKKILPCVKGLYKWDESSKSVNAILISHSHLDHYGFLPYVNPDIPVYASEGCKELLKIAHLFGQCAYDPKNVKVVPPEKYFDVGDLAIMPYKVDHSAPDAFAYKVKGGGKKVFYSGDFRGHGKKKDLFEQILKDPPKNIDALIMEGTTIERKDESAESEQDVEDRLVRLFKDKKQLVIFSCSHQNIDRLTVLYNACLKTGRTMVMIPYTAYILNKLEILSKKLPQSGKSDIRIFFESTTNTKKVKRDKEFWAKIGKAKISYEGIAKDIGNMVVLDSKFVRERFAAKGFLAKAFLVYSLWEGYLENAGKFWDEHGVHIEKIHSSGHASVAELKEFVKALDPAMIIPIHTTNPEKFQELFGEKVMVLSDGQRVGL